MENLCPYCGAPTKSGAAKCEYCGATLPVQSPAAAPQPQPVTYQQPPVNNVPNGYNAYPNGYNNGYPNGYPNGYNNGYPNGYIGGNPAINPAWPIKSKIVAALLALFLGGLGIHKFYLGKHGAGILMLLFCWTYIPSIIAFIDFIVLLCTNDENFQLKYQCRIK